MGSLVLELQQEATNGEISITNLLRKAFMVAKKLGIKEFEDWINLELNGYPEDSSPPNYRAMTGEIKTFNPYNNYWCPIIFEDSKMAEAYSSRSSAQPIGEIESLCKKDDSEGSVQMPFPVNVGKALMKGTDMQTPPSLLIPKVKLVGILEIIRNTVLNWALKLGFKIGRRRNFR